MVSLVGPICQATLEQLLSAVLSRILFTFPSCQQGDVWGNQALLLPAPISRSCKVQEKNPRDTSVRARQRGIHQHRSKVESSQEEG